MLVRGKYVIIWPDLGEKGGVLVDAAVRVKEGIISEIDRFDLLREKYPDDEVIGSPKHVVAPGWVNAHHHGRGLSMIEMGVPDDPLELLMFSLLVEPWTDPQLSAFLSALRLIESGVTTIIHSHRHYGSPGEKFIAYKAALFETMEGYRKAGIRAAFSMDARDKPSLVYGDIAPLLSRLPEGLRVELQQLTAFPKAFDYGLWFSIFDEARARSQKTRIKMLLGPLTAHSCTEKFIFKIKQKAVETRTMIHLHALETPYNIGYARYFLKKRQLEYFHDIGFLGPDVTLVHCVWASEDDIRILSESRASVVTCPSSNLRLKSGIAPINSYLQAGVNLGIGMDGITINDEEDFFLEMRLARNLHRIPGHRQRHPEAREIFWMATEGGARAAGLWETTGSLKVGKSADLILLRLDELTTPFMRLPHDLIEIIILRGRPRLVDTVMVEGEILYKEGRHLFADPWAIREELIQGARKKMATDLSKVRELVEKVRPYLLSYYEGWKPTSIDPYYLFNGRHWDA